MVGRLIEDGAARAALGRWIAENGPKSPIVFHARAGTAHPSGRFAADDIGGAGPLDYCLARFQKAAGISTSLQEVIRRN